MQIIKIIIGSIISLVSFAILLVIINIIFYLVGRKDEFIVQSIIVPGLSASMAIYFTEKLFKTNNYFIFFFFSLGITIFLLISMRYMIPAYEKGLMSMYDLIVQILSSLSAILSSYLTLRYVRK